MEPIMVERMRVLNLKACLLSQLKARQPNGLHGRKQIRQQTFAPTEYSYLRRYDTENISFLLLLQAISV